MKYILLPALLLAYFGSFAQDNHQTSAAANDKKTTTESFDFEIDTVKNEMQQ